MSVASPPISWRHLPAEIGAEEIARWRAGIDEPVAVTGATGFVGSHLVEALVAAGMRPRVAVRDESRLLPSLRGGVDAVGCGLADPDALAGFLSGCRTVLHLAGCVRAPSPAHFDAANASGTANLCDAVRRAAAGARVVYVSSLAAAGPSDEPAGRGPEQEPAPISAYGRSKLAGETAVRRYEGRWVILRPPAIYGPRDRDVLQFFRLASAGVVPLPSGERWITLAHVSDVVRAILAAASADIVARVLHLGEPEPMRMDALIARLAGAGDVRARIVRVPPLLLRSAGRCGDALHALGLRSVALTSDKARELLARHWSARTADSLAALGLDGFVSFDEGARQTWSWYREHGWLRGNIRAR